MLNRSTNTPILLLVFTFMLASMGARLETSSVISTEPPIFSDFPDMTKSILEQERTIKGHILPENLMQRQRKQFGVRNFNRYSETEKTNMIVKKYQSQVKVEQDKNNLGSMILSGLYRNLLVINQSIILTASASKNDELTLNFVDLVKKTKNSKVYPQIILQYSVFQNLAISLIDEKTLGIYSGQDFIVIDIQDLAIRQTLRVHGLIGEAFYRIDVHRKILLLQSQVQKGYILQLDYKTNQYLKMEEVYTPGKNLYLTGPNQGISTWNGKKIPVDLANEFPILEKTQEIIPPGFQDSIVVSNSEQMVAIVYLSPPQILFKALDKKKNYEMRYLFNITFPLRGFLTDSHKVRFTNDDKFLFFTLYQGEGSRRSVGIVDIQKAEVTYFDFDGQKGTDSVCFDYGILSNSQFVLVCQKNEWTTQNIYQLRLYNLSSFKILDTLNVTAEAANLQIKTNPNFDSTFILQTLNEERKSNLKMFKVVSNKIASSTVPGNFTNFKIVADCLNYLIGIFEGETYYNFVNVNNFRVVKKIPISQVQRQYEESHPLFLKYYFVQNRMLVIGNQGMYEFYDLSKLETGEDIHLCNFYSSSRFFFFLPNQKYTFQYDSSSSIIKGFDFQKCPTKKLIQIVKQQNPTSTFSNFLYSRVPESLQKSENVSCNVGYLLENRNTIFTFQDCEPYKTTATVISDPGRVYSIRLSSNEKYLILTLLFSESYYIAFQLDVRLISNLETSVYKSKMLYNKIFMESDVTENDELVYITQEGVFYEKMNGGKQKVNGEAAKKEEGEIQSLTE